MRAKLQREFVRVVQMKDVQERLIALGNDVVAGGGEEMSAHVDRELKLYAKIIKSAGIRPEVGPSPNNPGLSRINDRGGWEAGRGSRPARAMRSGR